MYYLILHKCSAFCAVRAIVEGDVTHISVYARHNAAQKGWTFKIEKQGCVRTITYSSKGRTVGVDYAIPCNALIYRELDAFMLRRDVDKLLDELRG